MDERHKEILMASVSCDNYMEFRNKFSQCKLIIEDDSLYDYELLKAALHRKEPVIAIVNFLLKVGCKVTNPSKMNSEETLLHLAMKLNDETVIRRMLKNGASIYDKNHKGETPLYAAFKEKHYNAVYTVLNYYSSKKMQQLNTSSISLNPMNKDDILHFHIACITNNVNAVMLYLKYGFDVNSPFYLDIPKFRHSNAAINPLHYAVINCHFKLVECLLKYGADISIKNGCGETVLHFLFSRFHDFLPDEAQHSVYHDMVRQVFRYGNTTKFINSLNSDGISHFHLCCTLNCPDLVKVFIDKGVDVNSAATWDCSLDFGVIPLHIAIRYGCDKVVQLLLENGADCNKVIKHGITPLHAACNLYSTRVARSIIKMLLYYEANVTAVDEKNSTPLHTAFDNFKHDGTVIYDMLLSKLPREVDFTNNQGLLYFHIICTRNDVSRVEDFLKAGVAVNSQVVSGKYGGYTALHFAVLHNQKDVVELLLMWNAQVNIKTNTLQRTPLHVAFNYYDTMLHEMEDYGLDNLDNYWFLKLKKQLLIIKLLLLHGADLNALDSLGRTPSIHVCSFNSVFSYLNSLIDVSIGLDHLYKVRNILHEILQIFLIIFNGIEELNRMKFIKVGNCTSLYSILSKDVHEFSKYVKNRTLVNVLEDQDINNKFPLYSDLLKMQFVKSLLRYNTLEYANVSLASIAGFNLPDLCCDSIFKHLTNEEIANLKAAALGIKRK